MLRDVTASLSHVEATLGAYFSSSFVVPDTPVLMTLDQGSYPPRTEVPNRDSYFDTLRTVGGSARDILGPGEAPVVRIYDARPLQAQAASAAVFFDEHGFVLLPHSTAVASWERDVRDVYLAEVDGLIRSVLLPGRKLAIVQSPDVLRRGPGTERPFYGSGVHHDYGLTPDDFQANLEAYSTPELGRRWRAEYERDNVTGFMVINFWRTMHMHAPLEHMPLTVCDPSSVAREDIVPTGVRDFTPTRKPSNQMALRFNPNQRWYYYPRMTNDEVLVFKSFLHIKRDRAGAPLRTCFHSAFCDPTASADAQKRLSCEHRVQVFVLD